MISGLTEKKKYKRSQMSDFEVDEEVIEEEIESMSLDIRREKLAKHRQKKKRQNKKKARGGWERFEQMQFLDFMKAHKTIFQSKEARRSEQIFSKMAKVIKSRSSQQCRSHHQKYEMKCHEFDEIVKHIEIKLSIGMQRLKDSRKQPLKKQWEQNHAISKKSVKVQDDYPEQNLGRLIEERNQDQPYGWQLYQRVKRKEKDYLIVLNTLEFEQW